MTWLQASDLARMFPGLRDVEVVIFDFWGVLASSLDKEPIKLTQKIFGHNVYPDGGEFRVELDPRFLEVCNSVNIRGDQELLEYLKGQFGFAEIPANGAATLAEIRRRERDGLLWSWDTHRSIEAVQQSNRAVGCCTNMWASAADHIFGTLGFESQFDRLPTVSCRVGFPKPRPQIFLAACQSFGVSPERCLMVGDNPRVDIEGALSIGMKAMLLDRGHQVDPAWCAKFSQVPVIDNLMALQGLPVRR